MEKVKQKKGKKIGMLIVNIVTILICLFVLFIVVNWFMSRSKGYTSYFGTVFLVVITDSMEGDKPDSFNVDDVIRIKEISGKEKLNLKQGQVITFWEQIGPEKQLNSHRFWEYEENQYGETVCVTWSDKYNGTDAQRRDLDDIVGVYQSKSENIGKTLLWMQSKNGFLICAVIPSLIIMAYCIVMVIFSAGNFKGVKNVLSKDELKEQLLEELRREGLVGGANLASEPKPDLEPPLQTESVPKNTKTPKSAANKSGAASKTKQKTDGEKKDG